MPAVCIPSAANFPVLGWDLPALLLLMLFRMQSKEEQRSVEDLPCPLLFHFPLFVDLRATQNNKCLLCSTRHPLCHCASMHVAGCMQSQRSCSVQTQTLPLPTAKEACAIKWLLRPRLPPPTLPL
ncbi:hypothetical protein BX070DRAFT_228780 [Coemansia spiralis]|nr:hypothetical protein BX070DRAFT_228780 [Coemansia spiralis]